MNRFLFLILWMAFLPGMAQIADLTRLEEEADILSEQEKYEEALTLYNKVLQQRDDTDPERYSTLYKRSVCYYSLDKFEEALQDINEFITANPAVPQARLLQAYIYAGMEDLVNQLESINALVKLDPLNTDLAKWQSSLLLQTGKYGEARKKLKWLKNLKSDKEVELYLGLTYYYDNEPDSALDQFDKAIQIDKTYSAAYLYAGSLCIQEEAYEMALSYLDKALAVNNNDLDALFYKGVALVELDRKEEGCKCLSHSFYSGNEDASGYLEQYCFKNDF